MSNGHCSGIYTQLHWSFVFNTCFFLSRIDCHEAIKVADFGLTEDMYGTKYFRMVNSETGNEEKVPIRWMAPESIENDIYNQSSDVVSIYSYICHYTRCIIETFIYLCSGHLV